MWNVKEDKTHLENKILNIKINNDIDFQVEQMIEKSNGVWNCKVCRKTTNQRTNIRQHAETHIEGMSHACHICAKTHANRHSLRSHMSDIHTDYSCNICGMSGMKRSTYQKHKH